jgi:drug/metabolite transporter (DMT)-like permease
MSSSSLISHLKLHFVVLIYGFTAILGKLISISAIDLVWYRMLIAAVSIYIYIRMRRISIRLPLREIIRILIIGLLVAAHWITFFGAIKLSNVSVTLGCLASATLFTSILEPLFYRKRLNWIEVVIGLLIIAGLYLIFQFEFHYWKGILTAIISAFLAGLFTVLNRKQVERQSAHIISFYEMIGGVLGITLFLLVRGEHTHIFQAIPYTDLIYLLLLGIVCTAFAFVVQVDVMRQLTAYVVALTINLEPVYGIILAVIFFGDSELMSFGFYIGTVVILLSIIGYPLYTRRAKKMSRTARMIH